MSYDAVIEAINNPTADFYQLFPNNNNGIFELFAKESTLPFNGKPWFTAQPRHFHRVEAVDGSLSNFRVSVNEGSCILSRENFDTLYRGYCSVYLELYEKLRDSELATKLASLAWLQDYHLNNSIFVPIEGGGWWDVYDKDDYQISGEQAHSDTVKLKSILTIFPDAESTFSHIRDLGLTSADQTYVIEQTCVKHKVGLIDTDKKYSPSLPGDLTY